MPACADVVSRLIASAIASESRFISKSSLVESPAPKRPSMPCKPGEIGIKVGLDERSPCFQPLIVDQTVAIIGTSTPSVAFYLNTRLAVLVADEPCSITWTPAGEATVAATASNLRIPANVSQKFGVSGGGKVSVITNS